MRIGHQIYNYLYDHVDSGRTNIVPPIQINDLDGTSKGHIYECYIDWKENQVYLNLITPSSKEKLSLSVNGFLKWNGGSVHPQSYKPLYELRDQLRKKFNRKTQVIYENT